MTLPPIKAPPARTRWTSSSPDHPSSSKAELVGTALGVLASHEAGHNFGNWHTDQFSPSANIMDTRPVRHLITDGVFGAPADPDLDFGLDTLASEATLDGQVNTLNIIAFGLATGTQDPTDQSIALWAATVDLLMAEQESERTSTSVSLQGVAQLSAWYFDSKL